MQRHLMVSGRPYTRHRAVKCPHMCPGVTTAVAPNLPVLQLQCCYGHCCCQQKKACQQHKLLPVCSAAAPASAPAVAPATAPAAVPACCSTYWPSVSLLQLRHQSINHKTQPQPQKPLQAISQEQRDSTIAIGSARTVQRTQRLCSDLHVKEE